MLATSLLEFDQAISHWITQTGLPIEELLRLLLAAVVGGLVGLERQVRGREAGFRTNLLVCVGSALVMLVSISLTAGHWQQDPGKFAINVDPGRIAYGVMTGIGFLGAGAIIRHGGAVRGLTTAAGLWCVAAAGLAAGCGRYLLCACAAVLVFVALWLLEYLETLVPQAYRRNLTIRIPWSPGCIPRALDDIRQHKPYVEDVSYQRTADLAHADVCVRIACANRRQYFAVEQQVQDHPEWQIISAVEP